MTSNAAAAAAAFSDVSPPSRFIFTETDMREFVKSSAKKELLRVVAAMGKSCSIPGNDFDPSTPLQNVPPALASLHGSLRCMETWLYDLPPQKEAKARFGNPVFRDWRERLVDRSQAIVTCILKCHEDFPPTTQEYSMSVLQTCSEKGFQAANVDRQLSSSSSEDANLNVLELRAYFHDAFGHNVRLDYGTGHESSFMVFLYSILKLGCFGNPTPDEPPSPTCLKAVTLSIWTQYLYVTRGLQMDYMLEPAGSHGVWGLDDYHCLPFYFGACQLVPLQDEYTPQAIHDTHMLESHASEKFLYFGCIQYIRQLKRNVPFFESSPMLNDISHLPTWSKVANGLLKLYEGEVLDKRQVVQHFRFGNLFRATWTASQVEKQAPTELFRTKSSATNEVAVPPPTTTRAPWAK